MKVSDGQSYGREFCNVGGGRGENLLSPEGYSK